MAEQLLHIDNAYWPRLKQGDADALGYFYDQYVDKLFPVAMKLLANRDIAKDCIQEVFVELWNYRESLGDVTHSQAYLVKVLRNIIFKKQKKQKPLITCEPADDDLISDGLTIEDILIDIDTDKETRSRLKRALSCLTDRQKMVLELRFNQGLSYEQIAEKLNMNYQSVNNLFFRTIIRLRGQMLALIILLYIRALSEWY